MALTDDLISYWSLEEASGNALDAHGSNDLTDNNTVGSGTGNVGNARDFEAGSTEYFSHADNADLSTGDIDFTLICWVNAESLGTNPCVLSKTNSDSSVEEYRIDYFSSRFRFAIKDSAGNYQVVEADNLGAPSTGTWYFIVAWHDASANTVNIQVNNGTVDSVATAGLGPSDTAADFLIGRLNTEYWDGLIDEVGFWKRVLTSQERSDLYNAGNGLAYDDFDAGGGTAVVVPGSLSLLGVGI